MLDVYSSNDSPSNASPQNYMWLVQTRHHFTQMSALVCFVCGIESKTQAELYTA